ALSFGMVNRVVPLATLDDAVMSYAQRLALVSPEALAATKLALNRGLDSAGFTASLRAGLDVIAPLYAIETDVGREFHEISKKGGVSAAVKWRRNQFDQTRK